MATRENGHLVQFEESLSDWVDERFLSRKDLRALAMFSMYLVNLADDDGWLYCGHSWKESQYLGCLVVKSVVDKVPSVAFTSAKTYTASVGIFLRKLEHGDVIWQKDKYRG